eukprot:10764934-Ditylum_brightwellii.AAC.1
MQLEAQGCRKPCTACARNVLPVHSGTCDMKVPPSSISLVSAHTSNGLCLPPLELMAQCNTQCIATSA